MKRSEFRIPTFIGLLLAGSIIGTLALVLQPGRISRIVGTARTPAATAPEQITISNITDTTAVIIWQTSQLSQGYVEYKAGNEPSLTSYDVRDKEDGIPKVYRTHYVELSHLPSGSTVSYSIVSGGTYAYDGSISLGVPFPQTISASPIHGELRTKDGSETTGTIVMATFEGSAPWSTFIYDTANWVIPLAHVRTETGDGLYCSVRSCERDTAVTLTFIGEEGTQTRTVPVEEARPLLPVVYGTSPGTEADILPSNIPTATTAVTRPPQPILTTTSWDVSILNPKQDAKLTFPKPLIRGQGVPGTNVTIALESSITQVGKTTVLEDGTWHWTPAYPLDPGTHTVRIDTVNSQGKNVRQEHTFYILKSGQQVLADSTPSASLTPTATPTVPVIPTPSTVTSISLTPSPTSSLSATPIITLTVSPTTSPTITPSPTLHVAGGFTPSLFIVTGGALLIVIAFALL
ncbi:hypothetical protein A3B56_02425 [Candidatus Roizmanbacteria bacterium RIFCSPLOWO2_01_FULL_45_11]|uniref:Bacterial Ig-like domain-containing protein n=1 Tax=Candidatus Roizmanbacteria bacterium RIFCSPLOWO2_01_FULL_45_11 TaxID=1802070 RepID=A0A1F7JIZ4_9BACT|nr:MAG: hypothetical protein A3B56_02425 [Candidatus Roizmanbacteria bacterium RIFCSPLOWO2_01_FULL_45_11]